MAVAVGDARRLWRVLGDGAWRKQGQIIKMSGGLLKGPKVRAICNEYAGHFISNTQQGYKLTRYATDEEIQHSINDLRSRCNKMQTRAAALERELLQRRQKELI